MKIIELFEEERKDLVGFRPRNSRIACDPEKTWSGGFSCENQGLTSLKGGPLYSDEFFNCSKNKLKNLKGAPRSVHTTFSCSSNPLTSLEGAPNWINGNFYCENTTLTSLHNIHKIIEAICGEFFLRNTPIKSHILGLLKIQNLQAVILDNQDLQDIINLQLRADRDILECQQELIEAGFDDYAQL